MHALRRIILSSRTRAYRPDNQNGLVMRQERRFCPSDLHTTAELGRVVAPVSLSSKQIAADRQIYFFSVEPNPVQRIPINTECSVELNDKNKLRLAMRNEALSSSSSSAVQRASWFGTASTA